MMKPASRPLSNRGTLTVCLGAAPGVGKTVAMLNEAHRLRIEGRDVVIGLIETHGRVDTQTAIGDLEIVPRITTVHKGVAIQEMDVNSVISREPEIVLVDELAHTNAPGSIRSKRYLDV
jgi:two-component system sensor histidine kinase KdpD